LSCRVCWSFRQSPAVLQLILDGLVACTFYLVFKEPDRPRGLALAAPVACSPLFWGTFQTYNGRPNLSTPACLGPDTSGRTSDGGGDGGPATRRPCAAGDREPPCLALFGHPGRRPGTRAIYHSTSRPRARQPGPLAALRCAFGLHRMDTPRPPRRKR